MDQWKQKILNVEKALQRQRIDAFNIAIELTAIHDDPEFLASADIAGDHEKAIEYLDSFAVKLFVIVPDNRSPYLDLAAMLREHPNKAGWKDGDLSVMYEAVLSRSVDKADPSPTKTRNTVTRSMYEELLSEVEQLRYENTQLHKRVAELQEALHRERYKEAAIAY